MLFALLVLITTPPPLAVTRGPGSARCSDTAALQAAVSERSRHTADVSGDATTFAIFFTQSAAGFEASIERRDIAGELVGVRHLAAADCEALSEAVALTVSMAAANPNPRGADLAPSASTQPSSRAATQVATAKPMRYRVAATVVPTASAARLSCGRDFGCSLRQVVVWRSTLSLARPRPPHSH